MNERRNKGCARSQGLLDINAVFLFPLYSLKLECEKLASEKIETHRHYTMTSQEGKERNRRNWEKKMKRKKGYVYTQYTIRSLSSDYGTHVASLFSAFTRATFVQRLPYRNIQLRHQIH